MKLNWQQFLILSCILLVGFFIRWGTVSYVVGPPVKSYPTMDEMNFRELAGNILEHRTFATWTEGFYTTSTRAPIYPLLVASGYCISGEKSYAAPKYLNLFLDTINILLVFVLAGGLFRVKMGLTAAAVYALFGHAVNYMTISSPHTLGLFLLLLVCIALTCLRHAYWLGLIALAVFYTFLIHTRPVFLIILPFLFIAVWLQISSKNEDFTRENSDSPERKILWWLRNNWKKKIAKSSLPIVLISLLCLPWGIRNYRQHKIIVPVCIIAGWHIASNENEDMKLSIQYLTDQLYSPERKNFTEGEYFSAAKKIMYKTFWRNPFKFIIFGMARMCYNWSPPGPFYRFFFPRAYVFPIRIFNCYILPLPDFEGMIYLFIFSTIALLFLAGWKVFGSWMHIFYRSRTIIIIILGYSLVHIIGIPLTAYRFLLEPLLMIILIQICSQYARMLKKRFPDAQNLTSFVVYFFAAEKSQDKNSSQAFKLITLYSILLIFGTILLLPFLHKPKPFEHTYFALLVPHEKVLNYAQLREMQWQNNGNIREDTIIKVQGQVRYVHQGFKFVQDDYYAAKSAKTSAAARLYVQYGSPKNPLGIGDVRLNFKDSELPKDGDVITVTGKASTGPFKEIIIDVFNSQIRQ